MTHKIQRRNFLAGSLAAAAATTMASSRSTLAAEQSGKQEFYELRIYRSPDEAKQKIVSDYLGHALLPALGRLGIDRVGVFAALDGQQGHALFTLIPYPSLNLLAQLNPALAADKQYQQAANEYFSRPKKDPAYTRIESRLMKAFQGMPVIELPAGSKNQKPRIFEVRIYESHNEEMARRKVEMFNEGEIELMRNVQLGPVFFGETLISSDVPNLTYMLSAENMEAHEKHWDAFRTHPEWARMKQIEKYKDTVSKITSIMLVPTDYSQI